MDEGLKITSNSASYSESVRRRIRHIVIGVMSNTATIAISLLDLTLFLDIEFILMDRISVDSAIYITEICHLYHSKSAIKFLIYVFTISDLVYECRTYLNEMVLHSIMNGMWNSIKRLWRV